MTAIPSISAMRGSTSADEADALAEPSGPVDVDLVDLDLLEVDLVDVDYLDVDPEEIAPPDADEPEAGRPPHLRVAPRVSPEVLRRRRRARLAVFGVAAISAASMFTLVAFHVFAVQSAYQLNHLNLTLTHEQQEYGLLRNKVAGLSSPEAVAKAAAGLGMVRAPDVTLLHAPEAASFGSNTLPAPSATNYSATAIATPGP